MKKYPTLKVWSSAVIFRAVKTRRPEKWFEYLAVGFVIFRVIWHLPKEEGNFLRGAKREERRKKKGPRKKDPTDRTKDRLTLLDRGDPGDSVVLCLCVCVA